MDLLGWLELSNWLGVVKLNDSLTLRTSIKWIDAKKTSNYCLKKKKNWFSALWDLSFQKATIVLNSPIEWFWLVFSYLHFTDFNTGPRIPSKWITLNA
jgi:hypothetical protein